MGEIWLKDIVGGGYEAFWENKSRYRIVKGGRGSKKSKTTALNLLVRLMQNENANLLCVRKTANTLYDSVFADLLWAMRRLEVSDFWSVTRSPMRMKFLQNGNEILFRGLDDALKLTSISVPKGVLCWIWVEEAYELRECEEFEKLDLTLRGEMPEGLFKQITMTFNPWLREHWLYDLYNQKDDCFAQTTTFQCNEFLDNADLEVFARMKLNQPERFKVEGLGDWGASGGTVFNNLLVEEFDRKHFDNYYEGLDWGYSDDPFAWIQAHYDRKHERLYVCDELYQTGLSNRHAYKLLKDRTVTLISADSSEPKSIAEMKGYGLRIKGAKKGPGSIETGIKWLQGLDRILIHTDCVDSARELQGLVFKRDGSGRQLPRTEGDDHLVDALRYAMESARGRRLQLSN